MSQEVSQEVAFLNWIMFRFVSSWFSEMIDYNLSSEINSLLPKLLLVKEFITTESKLEQQASPDFHRNTHMRRNVFVCLSSFQLAPALRHGWVRVCYAKPKAFIFGDIRRVTSQNHLEKIWRFEFGDL